VSDILKVEQFRGQVDANTPLFNRDPGWLRKAMNMRVRPGGSVEARGGYDSLRPSGGTTAAMAASGYIGGVHDHHQSFGAIMATANDGVAFSRDIAHLSWYRIFGPADAIAADPPVSGVGSTTHWWAFGARDRFSRLSFYLGQGAGGGSTYGVTWEYFSSSGGGTWVAIPSGPTEDFKTAGQRELSWTPPTNWIPCSLNHVYLYYVRCRITTAGVATQDAWGNNQRVLSDWSGRTIIVGATCAFGPSGVPLGYGQTTGSVATWDTLAPGGFSSGVQVISGRTGRRRFSTFQDRVMMADGFNNVAVDLYNGRNLGIQPPALSAFLVSPAAGAFGQACAFRYAMVYVGGSNGNWGRSAPTLLDTGITAFTAVQQAAITWTFSTTPTTGQVDVIEIYRTNDLTGVPVSAQVDQPYFRIAVLTRDVVGVLPTAYNDNFYSFPLDSPAMNPNDNLPPTRCKYIESGLGRVFLGSPEATPNRGYWSEPGEGENFNKDVSFAELINPMTGAKLFSDIWYLWSETEQIGVSDFLEEAQNVFEVPNGAGCVAPDAVAAHAGVMLWPGKDGIYLMVEGRYPERVTNDQNSVFSKMSYATHGGSRAIINDMGYEIHLLTPDGQPVGSSPFWRLDLRSNPISWSEITLTNSFSPLAMIEAPLGHADAGVLHPVYGNVSPDIASSTPVVGEIGTADNGTGYDCYVDIHFGPRGFLKFSPRRFAAYYMADSAWGTPIVSTPGGATPIFSSAATFGTPTPRTGGDYKAIIANCQSKQSGSQDIVVRFKATTVAGGLPNNQRLVAAYLEGDYKTVHPTG
jgi:hypothetical protein